MEIILQKILIGRFILTNTDNQGRGDFLDETRIEKNSSRPLENQNSYGKNKKPNPINILGDSIRNKVSSILTNDGEKIMSHSNSQSLQNQIDRCRDFCIGIDHWIKLNQKAIEDLKIAIDAASASNTLNEFKPKMNEHWKAFDQFIRESIFLLENHKRGFQTQAKVAVEAKNKLGQDVQLNNHLKGGLVDNIKSNI